MSKQNTDSVTHSGKSALDSARTELAQRWVRILYLEDVVHVQNSANLRQASEILGNRKDIADLQRQLVEVTRERDTLKAMVDLHDALNDRRRAQAAFEGADRRVNRG